MLHSLKSHLMSPCCSFLCPHHNQVCLVSIDNQVISCHVVCNDLVLSGQTFRQDLRVCAPCAEGAVIQIAYSTATALAGVGLLVGDWVLFNQVWYIISEEDV